MVGGADGRTLCIAHMLNSNRILSSTETTVANCQSPFNITDMMQPQDQTTLLAHGPAAS